MPPRSDSALQAQIDEQIQEHEKILITLKRQRNNESYVNRLPNELVRHIFRQVRDDCFNARSNPHSWFVVNAVIHRWREIAIGAPELWTHVDLSACSDGFVGLISRRSDCALLNVRMDKDRKNPGVWWDTKALFSNHLGRVEKLRLNARHIHPFLDLLQRPASSLQSLEFHESVSYDPAEESLYGGLTSVEREERMDEWEYAHYPAWPWDGLFSGDAPMLRRICISEPFYHLFALAPFTSTTALGIALGDSVEGLEGLGTLSQYLPNLENLQLDLSKVCGPTPRQDFSSLHEIRLKGSNNHCHSVLSQSTFGPSTRYFFHIAKGEEDNIRNELAQVLKVSMAQSNTIRSITLDLSRHDKWDLQTRQSIILWDTPEPGGRPVVEIELEIYPGESWTNVWIETFLRTFQSVIQGIQSCEISLAKCGNSVQYIFDNILAPCRQLEKVTLLDEWSLICISRTLERPVLPGTAATALNFSSLRKVIFPQALNGYCHRLGKELGRLCEAFSVRRKEFQTPRLQLCKIYHSGKRVRKYVGKEPETAIRITPELLGRLQREFELVDCVLPVFDDTAMYYDY